jgi:hypothetical protein
MIIMEVLRTVISYLQERGTSLQPFLFIAAISATRRILAIGAQMSVAHTRRVELKIVTSAGRLQADALSLACWQRTM